jgi:5S rRNA maturation endonuclease (ribonuclease M5)
VRRIAEGFALPSVPMKRPSKAPKIEEHRYREDCGEVIEAWRMRTTVQRTVEAAQTLGVAVTALTAYGFAWCPAGDGSWAFPMHDGEGRVCGIRLREPVDEGAAKWALKGSRAGLFLPAGVRRASLDRVFVVEGPTDAAALEWVYRNEPVAVIGRASCTGQHQLVVQAVRLLAAREPEVVVIADADGPGVEGANALADDLVAEFARVKVAVPQRGLGEGLGCKDIRQFVRQNDEETAFRLIELKVSARMWHRRRSVK